MNIYRIRIDVAANKSVLIFELSRYLKLSSALLWVLRWWLQFEIVSSHYSMKSVASEKHAWLWIRISAAGATVTVQLSNDEPRPCRAFSNNDAYYAVLVCLSSNNDVSFCPARLLTPCQSRQRSKTASLWYENSQEIHIGLIPVNDVSDRSKDFQLNQKTYFC